MSKTKSNTARKGSTKRPAPRARKAGESGAEIARKMFMSAKGATMADVVEATGDTQYNLLTRAAANGFKKVTTKKDGITVYHLKPTGKGASKAA